MSIGISMRQGFEVWAELEDAFRDGTAFVLYASTLGYQSAALELGGHVTVTDDLRERIAARARSAADGLLAVCEEFAERRNAEVLIDGLPPARWRQRIGDGFDHRTEITARQRQKNRTR